MTTDKPISLTKLVWAPFTMRLHHTWGGDDPSSSLCVGDGGWLLSQESYFLSPKRRYRHGLGRFDYRRDQVGHGWMCLSAGQRKSTGFAQRTAVLSLFLRRYGHHLRQAQHCGNARSPTPGGMMVGCFYQDSNSQGERGAPLGVCPYQGRRPVLSVWVPQVG